MLALLSSPIVILVLLVVTLTCDVRTDAQLASLVVAQLSVIQETVRHRPSDYSLLFVMLVMICSHTWAFWRVQCRNAEEYQIACAVYLVLSQHCYLWDWKCGVFFCVLFITPAGPGILRLPQELLRQAHHVL